MNLKEKNKSIFMPHDRGYKRSLSRPKEFLHFIKKYIGAEWMMQLKENQLTLCDKEFIDKDYDGKEADLIYRISGLQHGDAYIFVLQEMQSTVDYTMIFRILVYVVNTLIRVFLSTGRQERERKDFRLPAMVPIVFYNGEESWTAIQNFKEYQSCGKIFGEHILNLEYYLVNLSDIDKEDILSTNTLIDNIMYCDKFRKKTDLSHVLLEAFRRIEYLDKQDREEFNNWVKNIFLLICDDGENLMEEVTQWLQKGAGNMAFQHNMVRVLLEEREKDRAEGRAEGRTEGRAKCLLEVLGELGTIPEEMKEQICHQKDEEILEKWFQNAIKSKSVAEFAAYLTEYA